MVNGVEKVPRYKKFQNGMQNVFVDEPKRRSRNSNAPGIVKNPMPPCDSRYDSTTPLVTKYHATGKSIRQSGDNSDMVRARQQTPPSTQSPLSDRLMEMAGYRHISATACMVKVGRTSILSNSSSTDPGTTPNTDLVKKIYIPVYLNNIRVVGCMDSGSDITILQQSMYNRIFPTWKRKLVTSEIPFVTTFSDTQIKIVGKMHIFMKLSYRHPGLLITVYIVQDIPNVPVLLIGNDVFKSGLVSLSYTGNLEEPYPEIIFNNPEKFVCPVFYESAVDIYDCELECDIGPHETQDVIVRLPRIAPLIRHDYVLVTSTEWTDLIITPSRSDIEFISDKDYFIATAQVTNLGNYHFNGILKGKYELINEAEVYMLKDKKPYQIRELFTKHPLAKEVLYVAASQKLSSARYPYLTINQVSVSSQKDIQISDLDTADIIMDKEPNYDGEANIDSEIIEAKGLELPTLIYETAAEAVSLHSFSEEIRPFIKDIFVDKYPEVVSLHSLDAGNLSLTLGYTQLRLREGETLPRSRRIFHISPNDTRHLDDICELLIKF